MQKLCHYHTIIRDDPRLHQEVDTITFSTREEAVGFTKYLRDMEFESILTPFGYVDTLYHGVSRIALRDYWDWYNNGKNLTMVIFREPFRPFQVFMYPCQDDECEEREDWANDEESEIGRRFFKAFI
jgi:hypothetical protein